MSAPSDPLEPTGDLRSRVSEAILNSLALGAFPVATLLLVQGFSKGLPLEPVITILSCTLMVFPLLRLCKRWISQQLLRITMLAGLSAVAAAAATFSGITPGSSLVMMMLILLATIFWGARGALIALLGNLLLIGACAALVLTHTIELATRDYWNPAMPIVWVRHAVVFTVAGGSLALAFVLMIRALEQRAAALEKALLRERAEREAREKTEAALERSQRLEAMGQLAGGIAHDFNNMLSVVLGMAQLIEKSDDRASIKESAAMIREAGEASVKLARRLLVLGRKEQVPIERVSVANSLKVAQRVLMHSLPAGVAVSVDPAVDGEIEVPASQLEQALLNLALNAADAMAGRGKLHVACSERDILQPPVGWRANPGRFVQLSVSDSGSGMSEQTLLRIFEPFFTTKEVGRGSGLGLAMVRTFVFDSAGFIEVQSSLGQGTTFQLHLPLVPPTA